MKKSCLKIGSILMVAIPVTMFIACNGNNNNEENKKIKNSNDDSIDSKKYIPRHNKNQYPKYYLNNIKELDNDLSGYAWEFYLLKGKNYFKNNPGIEYPNRWNETNEFVLIAWGHGKATRWAIFNYYELYDYAHEQDLKTHYPNYDSFSKENKKIAKNNNNFPYLKNN